MPELPEVETFKEYLLYRVKDKKIKKIEIKKDKFLKNSTPNEFKQALEDKIISNVLRRAKFLIFEIEDYTLVSHLRMEGNFTFYPESYVPQKHDYIIFTFTDNTTMVYNDSRQFGTMDLYHGQEYLEARQIEKLGPEPWDAAYNDKYLHEKINKRSVAIKTLLLDQTIVSGIGNIYADEILWACQIHPSRTGAQVTLEECACIVENTKLILENSIKAGGTTVRSYAPGEGNVGKYVMNLNVYGRTGELCSRDGQPISKIKVNGRGTHYCGECQK